jgi:uncharacterized protein (TIGR00251 family)
VAGLHGESLKLRLAAPPVEGKANEALIDYIAKRFDVPKRNVEIVSGEKSREKRVAVRGSMVDPAGFLPIEDRDR